MYADKILKGAQPGRSSHRAAYEVRAGHQPQDRQGPSPYDPALAAGAGGSGHRVVNRRRFLLTSLAGALAGRLAAEAQQPATPVIGWLSARSREDTAHLVAAFLRGLGENGFVEGQNVVIEYRWAQGRYDRLPTMATEIVHRPVSVLASTGGEPAAAAAKAATSRVPIVFAIGGDPVKQGFTASFRRPGGNATGVSGLTNDLEPKRLGLLRELVPRAATIGVLVNPQFPPSECQVKDVQEAARSLRLQIDILRASSDQEISAAFDAVTRRHLPALAVAGDPFFDTRRDKLVALAAHHAIPTMYHVREFAEAGGLISYGIDFSEVYRQVGVYVGQILKGAKPADLPVMEPSRFELVINLKTAKALGLTIPPSLLARVDQVIE
jgi:ABC-type uncharacterized transport system substrate-binding protein